jgi:impB/mucB/samB family
MRLLHLDWPHLPLRLERMVRPLPELAVLGGHPWDPGRVLDCSPSARRHGVRRGMTLAAAHALVPDAAFLVPDLDRYRAAAEAALDALSAFAPCVEGETDPVRDGFGGAYLGIDGLERLWGTEPVLLGRLAAAIAPHVPGPLRAGIAGSRFGSLVAAILARDPMPGTGVTWLAAPVGGADSEAAFLAPLPVTLLPASPDTQERLRVLGVRRIGEFAALPRAAVMARFGAEGSFLHDLATGCDGRRIVPRRPAERLRAEAELDPPIDSLESIRFVLHRLADALCGQLTARGAGATLARLECHEVVAGRRAGPVPGARPGERGTLPDVMIVEQPLPGPIAKAEAVERLLLARLEKAPPGRPVERIVLELDRVIPAAGRQLGLFAPQAARAARLEWQLADLAIRFGEGRVLRAALHDPEARLPEQRSGWLEATRAGRVP